MPFSDAPIRLRMRGSVQQRAVDGLASVSVDPDGVVVVPLDDDLHAGDPRRIAFDLIDGLHADPAQGTLTVLLRSGERVEAVGDPRVESLARNILARARAVPEVTRALRALGARRGGTGQDSFFAPFLAARRLAASGADAALDAFDAGALRIAVEAELGRIAAEREPQRLPARRALEARLTDAAEALFAALNVLADAAIVARAADEAVVLAAWRGWSRALLRVFECADAAWVAVAGTVAAHVPRASHGR